MFGINCVERGGQITAFRVLELSEPDEHADPMKIAHTYSRIHPMPLIGDDEVWQMTLFYILV